MEWGKRKGDEGRKGNTVQRIQQRNGKNSKSKQQNKHYFQFLIVRSLLFRFDLDHCVCVCICAVCSCQCCDAQQTAKAQTLQHGLQM